MVFERRIFIIFPKDNEDQCISHLPSSYTPDNYSLISSNITKYLTRPSRSNTGTSKQREFFQFLFSVLMKKFESISKTPSSCSSDSSSSEYLLHGVMSVLRVVICTVKYSREKDNSAMLCLIVVLFRVPSQSDAREALCRKPKTRRAAFDLLLSGASTSKVLLEETIDLVQSFLNKCEYPDNSFGKSMPQPFFDRLNWVSLDSQIRGFTCYMNATVQQLFMLPKLRHVILEACLEEVDLKDVESDDEEDENDDNDDEDESSSSAVLMLMLLRSVRAPLKSLTHLHCHSNTNAK